MNTTVATITTPTYSSGVSGLNGVKQDSAFIQRCMKQTLNIGENLKWQLRGTALFIGKALQTTKGYLSEIVVWSGLQQSVDFKLQLTKTNHDSLCSHKIIVALGSNPHRITHQIRGSLNSEKSMVIAELSRKPDGFRACGETRRCASFGMVV